MEEMQSDVRKHKQDVVLTEFPLALRPGVDVDSWQEMSSLHEAVNEKVAA